MDFADVRCDFTKGLAGYEMNCETHCWHDNEGSSMRGYVVYGSAVCCNCGVVRQWRRERGVMPSHGPYCVQSAMVRTWVGPDPRPCEPRPREQHEQPDGPGQRPAADEG